MTTRTVPNAEQIAQLQQLARVYKQAAREALWASPEHAKHRGRDAAPTVLDEQGRICVLEGMPASYAGMMGINCDTLLKDLQNPNASDHTVNNTLAMFTKTNKRGVKAASLLGQSTISGTEQGILTLHYGVVGPERAQKYVGAYYGAEIAERFPAQLAEAPQELDALKSAYGALESAIQAYLPPQKDRSVAL